MRLGRSINQSINHTRWALVNMTKVVVLIVYKAFILKATESLFQVLHEHSVRKHI